MRKFTLCAVAAWLLVACDARNVAGDAGFDGFPGDVACVTDADAYAWSLPRCESDNDCTSWAAQFYVSGTPMLACDRMNNLYQCVNGNQYGSSFSGPAVGRCGSDNVQCPEHTLCGADPGTGYVHCLPSCLRR